ncbi:MAG: YqgE/AlgH family protein [Acidobacteria bacterium]|nr:YqgE/AlgH family protein [Acidobacteriota bacterium]
MLLVARRDIPDPRFQQTVILVLAHDERGTLGLVLNRPTDASPPEAPDSRLRLFIGGPVAPERIIVLGRGDPPVGPHLTVFAGVWSSADQGVIDAALRASPVPESLKVFRGHAAWGPGQLDAELARTDAWALFLAEADDVFTRDPESLWDRFMGPNRPIPVRGLPSRSARPFERHEGGLARRSARVLERAKAGPALSQVRFTRIVV